MRRIITILAAVMMAVTAAAQRISVRFSNTPLSVALQQLARKSDAYHLQFIFDDLDEFTVTTTIRHSTLPEAIRQVIGFYPVSVTTDGNDIFIECIQKEQNKLKGRITDAQGRSIAFANIQLTDPHDSSYVNGGVSNEAGRFVIPCAQRRVMAKVSCIGYKTQHRLMTVGASNNVTLHTETMGIRGVTVKGRRPVAKMENGRLSYSAEAIRQRKILTTAFNLVTEVPSVQREGRNSFSLTGASSTTVIIDGKPTTMTQEALMDYLHSLPAEKVDRIELMYNCPPSLHLKGSAINVVMKHFGEGTVSGQLQGEYDNYHASTYRGTGSVSAEMGRWSLNATYSFMYNNNLSRTLTESHHTIKDKLYDITSNNKEVQTHNTHNVYASAAYRIGKTGSIEAAYTSKFQPKFIDRQYTQNSYFDDTYASQTRNNHWNDAALSLSLPKIKTGAEWFCFRTDGVQDMNYLKKEGSVHVYNYNTGQEVDKIRAYADMSTTFSPFTISYGASYSYVKTNNYQLQDMTSSTEIQSPILSSSKEHTADGYVGISGSLWKGKLSYDASVKYEYYKINDYRKNTFMPNMSLTWKLVPSHTLMLSYNTYRIYPSYWNLQDYKQQSDEYVWVYGNPDLKPVTYRNLNLTWLIQNRYTLSVLYYRISNFFQSQSFQSPDELKLIYQVQNADLSTLFNIMASAPFAIGKWYDCKLTALVFKDGSSSDNWFGNAFKNSQWAWSIRANNTFTLCQRPKLSLSVDGFYRTKTIQGAWNLSSNWAVNSALKCAFADGRAVLELTANDIFESRMPQIYSRLAGQNMHTDINFYRRGIELTFTYKFKGYKQHKQKNVDTSRMGI